MINKDQKVVNGFGDEWTRFNQAEIFCLEEHQKIFDSYFDIFPLEILSQDAVGIDVGCGSGRWAKLLSPKVGKLYCVDASSDALAVAKRNLSDQKNVEFINASVDAVPIPNDSLDFGYSLGVLHHMPDTQAGMTACVEKLKVGAPFLVYLYYAFDNQPFWFKSLWKISDVFRYVISRMPMTLRYWASQVMAFFVYYPLARLAYFFEKLGGNPKSWPLSVYRDKSFYTMRTDALDRFGTRLEQRFTKNQIKLMMEQAGLEDIVFSDQVPFWTAVGYKKN